MAIISVSIDPQTLQKLDQLSSELQLSGRSEAMRRAINHLVSETSQTQKLKGHTDCVLLVFHKHSAENVVTSLKHKFEDAIKTQLHANMHEGKCMELFLLEGPAERIKEMARSFHGSKKIDYTKLLPV